MNGAVFVSRIPFPCCVWHLLFSKRRRTTVFLAYLFVAGGNCKSQHETSEGVQSILIALALSVYDERDLLTDLFF